MNKVFLPKSTAKIYYYIFRGVSILDVVIVFAAISFGAMVGLLIPVGVVLKIVCAVPIVSLGFLLILKTNGETRLYKTLMYGMLFIFRKKKIGKVSLMAKPLKEQDSKTGRLQAIVKIKYTDSESINYLASFKLTAANLVLLNQQEQAGLITDFGNVIKAITVSARLVKVYESYDFDSNVNYLQQFKNNDVNNGVKQDLLREQIGCLEYVGGSKALQTAGIYLVLEDKNKERLQQQIDHLESQIAFSNLSLELVKAKRTYQVWHDISDNLNNSSASGLGFYSKVQKQHGFVWTISSFPLEINPFWLSELFNVDHTKIVININSIGKLKAKKMLDGALNKVKTNAKSYAYRASDEHTWKQYADSYEVVLAKVLDDTDTLKEFNFYIEGFGSKSELAEAKSQLRNLAQIKGWKYDKLSFLQRDAMLGMMTQSDKLAKTTAHQFTCEIFSTSFPVPSTSLIDKKGFYLGDTTEGKPVCVDWFTRNDYRINSNVLVLGQSGSGKSYLSKKIIANLALQKERIFIIDPEREYKALTEQFGGQWLDASGNRANVINPLQIYKLEGAEQSNSDAYLDHLAMLESFFSLIAPSLMKDDLARSLVVRYIKQLYQQFRIEPNTDFSQFKNNDWPTFDDLYQLVDAEQKQISKAGGDNHQLIKIMAMLELLTSGQYSKYWNGHTAVRIDKEAVIVCFDLHTLLNVDNRKVINLQMMLLLRMLNQVLIETRAKSQAKNTNDQQKVLIAIDEAHLLIDENNPMALDFCYATMKRIRKYNGALLVITQNVADFADGGENVKRKFKGIINNCQYWLIGGLQPNDLNDLSDMYRNDGGLSEAVKNYIATAKRGKFWFKVSQQYKMAISVVRLNQEAMVLEG